MPDQLITVREATELFGVARQRVREYMVRGIALGDGRRNRLPYHKGGDGRLYIRFVDALRYKRFLEDSNAPGAKFHRVFRGHPRGEPYVQKL